MVEHDKCLNEDYSLVDKSELDLLNSLSSNPDVLKKCEEELEDIFSRLDK